jgi:hypothetical protein
MGISVRTQKMLWGRAASRCAFCRRERVMDATLTDDESLVGEACHIVAAEEDGPRGKSALTREQRDKYANLVLLCNVHHKQVDDQTGEYSVDRLIEIKGLHETWVRQQLQPDLMQQRDGELYATYIDEWEKRVGLEKWNSWASWTFSAGQPQISKAMNEQLAALPEYLLGRVWPKRYPELEAALTNFRLVCRDYHSAFHEDVVDWGDKLAVAKFYKARDRSEDRYNHLLKLYEAHCAFIECLMLELTRSANLVCDMVRGSFLPSYRLREGVCLVTSGPYMPDLAFRTHRVEYRGDERKRMYPGLVPFLDVRFERDSWFGKREDNELLRKFGDVGRRLMTPDS